MHLVQSLDNSAGSSYAFVGKQAVSEAIGGFYQAIDGMQHEFLSVHDQGSEAIVEANVNYTRKDGRRVVVRAATFFHRQGDLVDNLRVYLDTAPVKGVYRGSGKATWTARLELAPLEGAQK